MGKTGYKQTKNAFRVSVYFGTKTIEEKKMNWGEGITLILFTKIKCDLVPSEEN